MMDQVIRGKNRFAGVCLYYQTVFSTTWEDHLAHFRTVMSSLMEVGLTTKPSKCQLAMAKCTCLGHVVGNGVVKPETSCRQ